MKRGTERRPFMQVARSGLPAIFHERSARMNWWRWIVWGPIAFGFLMAIFAGLYAIIMAITGKD